jgi:hypothetical protein
VELGRQAAMGVIYVEFFHGFSGFEQVIEE